jgi:hypothetical protein
VLTACSLPVLLRAHCLLVACVFAVLLQVLGQPVSQIGRVRILTGASGEGVAIDLPNRTAAAVLAAADSFAAAGITVSKPNSLPLDVRELTMGGRRGAGGQGGGRSDRFGGNRGGNFRGQRGGGGGGGNWGDRGSSRGGRGGGNRDNWGGGGGRRDDWGGGGGGSRGGWSDRDDGFSRGRGGGGRGGGGRGGGGRGSGGSIW